MLILVTNDDGVLAPGIQVLADVAARFGEVAVVAPESEKSGVSHQITLLEPLRVRKLREGWHAMSGTPVDCVYIGMNHVLPRRPDLVLSGINRGPNLGNDVIYSGTVAGAMEAAMHGIPALAFSLVSNDGYPFEASAVHVEAVVREAIAGGLPPGVMLNVNIPAASIAPFAGYRVARVGRRFYSDDIVRRVDPRGGEYLWVGGTRITMDTGLDTDCGALVAGYVTVTPLRPDLMARDAMDAVKRFEDIG